MKETENRLKAGIKETKEMLRKRDEEFRKKA